MDPYLLACMLFFHDGTKETIESGPFATEAELWAALQAEHYVSEHWFKDRGITCLCVGCSDPVVEFDIQPQPLATALTTLADQADLQILYTSEAVQGLTARGVSGVMTAAAALAALLTGTPLESVRKRVDVFVVRSAND